MKTKMVVGVESEFSDRLWPRPSQTTLFMSILFSQIYFNVSTKKRKNALKINFRQECFERGEQVSGIKFTYFETALTGLEAETNKCWAF